MKFLASDIRGDVSVDRPAQGLEANSQRAVANFCKTKQLIVEPSRRNYLNSVAATRKISQSKRVISPQTNRCTVMANEPAADRPWAAEHVVGVACKVGYACRDFRGMFDEDIF